MSEFKIGDKVKITKLIEESDCVKIGDIGIVVKIQEKKKYPIRLNINDQIDYGFEEEELVFVGKVLKEYIGLYDGAFIDFKAYKILAKDYSEAEKIFLDKIKLEIPDNIFTESVKKNTYLNEDMTLIELEGLETIQ